MKFILTLFLVLAISSKLVFQDNFDTFNFKTWRHEITMGGGGNWEFELYDNNRSTTFVKNGILNIKPVPTADKIGQSNVRNGYTYSMWGGAPADYCTANSFYGCQRTSNGNNYINPIMSGRITTVNSTKIRFGRVQVKAKLPKGNWLWPAIWMMPAHNQYGSWPASGEIDIMESRGNVGYPKSAGGGVESFGSTLHWGPDWSRNQFSKTHAEYSLNSGTFNDDFHTFGLYWDDKILYTYVDSDSNRVLSVNHSSQSYWDRSGIKDVSNPWQYSSNKCAPFDTQFYLIINLAVGGVNGYFPDGVGGKPWSDQSGRASADFWDNKGTWWSTWGQQSVFQVDSVKMWDLSNGEEEIKVGESSKSQKQIRQQ